MCNKVLLLLRFMTTKPSNSLQYLSKFSKNKSRTHAPFCTVLVTGGIVAVYTAYQCIKSQSVLAYQSKHAVKLTSRERRFIKFASAEYNGQLYMTPQDFLESVVEAKPRLRLKRKMLSTTDMDYIKDNTPPLTEGSPRLFRNLRHTGIISYSEYLFLLSVLTKPESGFRIAFNMFDMDHNEKIDKNEFLVIRKLLAGKRKEIKIFSHAWKGKRGLAITEDASNPKDDDEQGVQKHHAFDTTLIIHLFGPTGKNELRFEEFWKFMLNLQTEVLELEFSEFSKGFPTISEVDFAKILLRYTYLDTDECDMYLERLLDRIKETKGITFEEFYIFCQFLNNLEDFNIAGRMYTLTGHRISKDEFHRAVKICTGTSLSQHIVHTIFSIFDKDGDGLLSYREFIAIMKDRFNRSFKSYTKKKGWKGFKNCMRRERRRQFKKHLSSTVKLNQSSYNYRSNKNK